MKDQQKNFSSLQRGRQKKQDKDPESAWLERKPKIDASTVLRRPNRIQPGGEYSVQEASLPLTHPIKFDPFKVLGLNARKSKLLPLKGTTEYEKLTTRIADLYQNEITTKPASKADFQRRKLEKLAGTRKNLHCDVDQPQGRRITKDGGVEYLCNWFAIDPSLCTRNSSVVTESPEEYFTKKDLANPRNSVATESPEEYSSIKKHSSNDIVAEVVDLTNDTDIVIKLEKKEKQKKKKSTKNSVRDFCTIYLD